MKKILLFATAAIMLAGCTKNEVFEGSESTSNQIRITPDAGKQQTKGGVTVSATLKDFHAHAYTYSGALGANTPLTHAEHTDVTTTDAGATWESTTPLFWSEGLKHAFYAISPAPVTNEASAGVFDPANPGTAINNASHDPKNELVKYTYTLPLEPEDHIDVLGGRAINVVQSAEIVNIPLNHITTRLNISAKLSDLSPKRRINVTGLKVLGTNPEGTVAEANAASKFYASGDYAALATDDFGEWNGTASATPVDLVKIMPAIVLTPALAGDATGLYTDKGVEISTTTATALFSTDEYLFLIPPYNKEGVKMPTDVRILLTYDVVNILTGGKTTENIVVSLPNGSLKMGIAYNATFIIGVDTEVEFETVVEEWNTPITDDNTDFDAPSVVVDDVSTQSLMAAIAQINELALISSGINEYNIYVNADMPADGEAVLTEAITENLKVSDKIRITYKGAIPTPTPPTPPARRNTRTSTFKITPPQFWVAQQSTNVWLLTKESVRVYPAANTYIINTALVEGNDFIIPYQQVVRGWEQMKELGEKTDIQELVAVLTAIENNGPIHTSFTSNSGATIPNWTITKPRLTNIGMVVDFGDNTATLISEGANIRLNLLDGPGGKVMWSWNLWFTDYNPDATPVVAGNVHTYGNGKVYMDRNLGATITGPTTTDGGDITPTKTPADGTGELGGLYFQWGRKDALVPVKAPATAVVGPTTVAATVAAPGTFITADVDPYNWYNGTQQRADGLWAVTKTAFDPCPFGWKVAITGSWSDWNKDAVLWDATNKGRTYTTATGAAWYPAAGRLSGSTGTMESGGTSSYVWSSAISSTYALYLYFSSTGVYPAGSDYRTHACSVRCVRE